MRRTEARSLAPSIHNMRLEMSKAASSSNADPAADLHAYLMHVGTPAQGNRRGTQREGRAIVYCQITPNLSAPVAAVGSRAAHSPVRLTVGLLYAHERQDSLSFMHGRTMSHRTLRTIPVPTGSQIKFKGKHAEGCLGISDVSHL